MKFNWDSFKNAKIAVNCKTREEAEEFCREMNEHGLAWCVGNSYLEDTYWEEYYDKTCYSGNGQFCDIDCYEEANYKIFGWLEIKEGV